MLKDGAIDVWSKLKRDISSLDDKKYEEYLRKLDRIEKIKEYRIPVEILHTDDYEEITEAFIRINSKGTKLKEAELALAQLALRLPGRVSQDIEEALAEFEDSGFEC